MVDVVGLADATELSADDFRFRIGNDEDPAGWADAPAPQSIRVEAAAGTAGADRVTIFWADAAITGQWLQVTVHATPSTGLAEDDVFYFGNAIGEAGNSTRNAIVDATDEIACRNFQHGPINMATIDDPYDYNRDRLVNVTDRSIARGHQTGPTTALRLITPPAGEPKAADQAIGRLD